MKFILKSHVFFSESLDALTPAGLARIWGVKPRQAYRYAQDPVVCSTSSRDPLHRLIEQLERLKEISRIDVVESGLKMLAEPVGYHVGANQVSSDKESTVQELLDVNREIGKLAETIQQVLNNNHVTEDYKRKILRQADEAIRQLLELKDAISKGLK